MTLNLNSHYARSPATSAPVEAPAKEKAPKAKKPGRKVAKSKLARTAATAAKRVGKGKSKPAKKK